MNRRMKIALCIGLTGLGMFVWTHFAAAKGKPAKTPVVVTFLSGDMTAAPQILPGPFTATIDFVGYIPYLCPDCPAGGEALLRILQTKNPITYDSLSIKTSGGPLYSRLDFKSTIDGKTYTITMNAFRSGTTEVTTTLDTMHWSNGRFAVVSKNKLLVVAGYPDGIADVAFTMTK
jgi:hypothetical protein